MLSGEDSHLENLSGRRFFVLFGSMVLLWSVVLAVSIWVAFRPAEQDPDWRGTKDVLTTYAATLSSELQFAVDDMRVVAQQPYFNLEIRKNSSRRPHALLSSLEDFSRLAFYTPEGELLDRLIGSSADKTLLEGVMEEPQLQLDAEGNLMLLLRCEHRGNLSVLVGWREVVPPGNCQLLVGAHEPPEHGMIEIPVAFPNPMTDARLRWSGTSAPASAGRWIWLPLALLPLLLLPALLLFRNRRLNCENASLNQRLSESEILSQSAHRDRERIEMVRKISGGIAHDFKNFLTTILGNLSLLEQAEEHERAELVGDATNAALVASELAHQLMAMSDQVEINPQLWRATHLVRNAERLIHKVLPFDVRVELDLQEDLWSVQADSTHMGRVFHNLMVNAIHAMPEGGTIRFSARNLPADAVEDRCDMVEFEILDEGVGMAPEIISRIFEPYFSTKGKEYGKVNGLGLYIASTIMHGHGGTIECSSEIGTGTSFRVCVPRSTGVETESAAAEPDHLNHALRLLVVDDEEIFRNLTTDLLTRYGFSVVTARDGKEAVDVASQSLEPFDLILLDLKMPVLSGTKVFRLLRERGVKTPVVVCTGFPDQAQSFEEETGQPPDAVVLKPFDFEVLVKTVERVLNNDPRIRN